MADYITTARAAALYAERPNPWHRLGWTDPVKAARAAARPARA